MFNYVKSSPEVQQDKNSHQSIVWCCNAISDFEKCCFFYYDEQILPAQAGWYPNNL